MSACSEEVDVPTPDFSNIFPGYDAGGFGDGSFGDGSLSADGSFGDGSFGDGSFGDGSSSDGSSSDGSSSDGSLGDGSSSDGSLGDGSGEQDGESEPDAGEPQPDGGSSNPPPADGGKWTLNADSAPECPPEPPPIPIIGGACLGIYYSCGWTNEAGQSYTCICDWIHWLCL